jgi:hypothetical protein
MVLIPQRFPAVGTRRRFPLPRYRCHQEGGKAHAWKTALDGCENDLPDDTCVPFLTEVAAIRTRQHARDDHGKPLTHSR